MRRVHNETYERRRKFDREAAKRRESRISEDWRELAVKNPNPKTSADYADDRGL
jgi:hypothetical protein